MDMQMRELEALDLDKLADLNDILSPAKVTELVSLFLNEVSEQLQSVHAAIARTDYSAVAREAHVLVSTSGNIGAVQLSITARNLEQACAEGDEKSIAALVAELTRAAATATMALKKWLGQPQSRDLIVRTVK
jgi:HPt (histidine-containing phosphotransfer) domain-containing protein